MICIKGIFTRPVKMPFLLSDIAQVLSCMWTPITLLFLPYRLLLTHLCHIFLTISPQSLHRLITFH